MASTKNFRNWLTGSIAASFLLLTPSLHADTFFGSDGNLPFGSLGTASGVTLPSSGVFSSAQGIAFDPNGNIVVSYYGGALNRYSSTGVFLANLANLGSGNGGVTVDLNGNIYLSHGNRVDKFNSTGTLLSTVATLNAPQGLDIDTAGNLYVADSGAGTIEKYSPAGVHLLTISGISTGVDVAVTSSNEILVSNYNANTISKFAADGTSLGLFATGLHNPWGLAVTDSGNLLVANRGNNTISELSSTGLSVNSYSISTGIPTYVATPVVVPEPSAFGMVGMGALALVTRRKRK